MTLADKALALFLDPFDSFLGDKIDANSNPSIRRVMSPLGRIAHETGAVIASVRHLNKDSKIINTLYRGGGSMGITAASWASFLSGIHPPYRSRYAHLCAQQRQPDQEATNITRLQNRRSYRRSVDCAVSRLRLCKDRMDGARKSRRTRPPPRS